MKDTIRTRLIYHEHIFILHITDFGRPMVCQKNKKKGALSLFYNALCIRNKFEFKTILPKF